MQQDGSEDEQVRIISVRTKRETALTLSSQRVENLKGKVLRDFFNPGQRQWLLSLKEGGGPGCSEKQGQSCF